MKKVIIVFVSCLICNYGFAGSIVDFVESGNAPGCKDLKIKMLDLQKQLKEVESEYNSVCVSDDSVSSNEVPKKENVDSVKCDDGSEPDANGCCTDEIYTDMGREGFNCCPKSGGECFPPLKIIKQK